MVWVESTRRRNGDMTGARRLLWALASVPSTLALFDLSLAESLECRAAYDTRREAEAKQKPQ
jgi:hypothetical protein